MEIEAMKGKVRVYARVRPFNDKEYKNQERVCIKEGNNMWSLLLNNPKTDLHGHKIDNWTEFSFDQVFLHQRNGSQEDIFEDCIAFAELAYSGFNTCIFAYGQSGAGKTYTMAGTPEQQGLKPRILQYLFQMKESDKKYHQITISAYMVEVYLNKLEDVFFKVENSNKMIASHPPAIKIRLGRNKQVLLQGALEITFDNVEQAIGYCEAAELHRRTRRTGLNEASSRSHLIFGLLVKNKDLKTGKTTVGKMSLVDLAGSERAKKTNIFGLSKEERAKMLEEGVAINQSLTHLKNVFRILGANESNKKEVVQYRGNVLTELMQDCLGGNARTLMFVNVGPALSNVEESLDSLRYSTYVQNIKNEQATADADYSEEKQKLLDIIYQYKTKYGTLEQNNANSHHIELIDD